MLLNIQSYSYSNIYCYTYTCFTCYESNIYCYFSSKLYCRTSYKINACHSQQYYYTTKCYLTQHQGIYDILLKTLCSYLLQFLHFQIINLVSNKNVFIIVLCFELTDPITSSVYVRLNCSFGTNTFIFVKANFPSVVFYYYRKK